MATKSAIIKYISRIAAGIVFLALVTTVIIQNRRINALTGEVNSLSPRENVEKYKAENDRLKSQIADMQEWQDYLEDALKETNRDSAAAPQSIPVGNRVADNTSDIMNNPVLRNGLRSSVSFRYDALTEEIGLSEEKKSKLIDLLAEMRLEIMNNLPRRGGFAPEMIDRETLRQQIEEINSKYNEKISALLSPDELYAFKEYQNSEPERMLIAVLNNNLFKDDNLLDKNTEKELVAAMYSAIQANPDTKREDNSLSFLGRPFGPAGMNERLENEEKLNSIYIESARDILSEDQMKIFEDFINTRQSGFSMRRGPRPDMFPGAE
ncbi:MAG: hypothetical protein PVG39_15245 [Desulfobacteraceae bacterium]|jgi:hypothetical protein